ncbi:hypothetical protein, partial [Parapedobacter soli]|uniref:hypothetical protein n=1 Tax=Parapedobacter soli TaxID=416955 RepID=UPI0021C65D1C
MKIKNVIIILNIAGLIGSLIWLMVDKGWEPLVTSIGLIGALIAQIYISGGTGVSMKQKGGKGSKNYQSGGDININSHPLNSVQHTNSQ